MITYKATDGKQFTVPDTVPQRDFMEYCQKQVIKLFGSDDYMIYGYGPDYLDIVDLNRPSKGIRFYVVEEEDFSINPLNI